MGFFFAYLILSRPFFSPTFISMRDKLWSTSSLLKAKQYMVGFLLIIVLLTSGQLLGLLIPLPAPVIGLLLCSLLCAILGKVPKSLQLISQLLLSNMALFFLPLIISATLYIDLIRSSWLPILLSLIISTLIAIVITAKLADKNLDGTKND